jgi:hypothetical protein
VDVAAKGDDHLHKRDVALGAGDVKGGASVVVAHVGVGAVLKVELDLLYPASVKVSGGITREIPKSVNITETSIIIEITQQQNLLQNLKKLERTTAQRGVPRMQTPHR